MPTEFQPMRIEPELWRNAVDVLSVEHAPEDIREFLPPDTVRVLIYCGETTSETDFSWIAELSESCNALNPGDKYFTMIEGRGIRGTLADCEEVLYTWLYL